MDNQNSDNINNKNGDEGDIKWHARENLLLSKMNGENKGGKTFSQSDAKTITCPDMPSAKNNVRCNKMDELARKVYRDKLPFQNASFEEATVLEAEIRERWQRFVSNDPFPTNRNLSNTSDTEDEVPQEHDELRQEDLEDIIESYVALVHREDQGDENSLGASFEELRLPEAYLEGQSLPQANQVSLRDVRVVHVADGGDLEDHRGVVTGYLVPQGIQWKNPIWNAVPCITPLTVFVFIFCLLTALLLSITIIIMGARTESTTNVTSTSPISSLFLSTPPSIMSTEFPSPLTSSQVSSPVPSETPTMFRSVSPTSSPEPSSAPTETPTTVSSTQPTSSPAPSAVPTERATTVPSGLPTTSQEPSPAPTFSSVPSPTPTLSPTAFWNQRGADVDGQRRNDLFGLSVAFSPDHNRLWVGAFGKLHMRTFTTESREWETTTTFDYFRAGIVVSVSTDGKTFVVGDPYTNGNTGAALAFREGASGWNLVGLALSGDPQSYFGYSVDVSGNGNTIVVGAIGTSSVSVFDFPGSDWVLRQKIQRYGRFGFSVGLSSDASRLVVGDPWELNNSGAAFVYSMAPLALLPRLGGDALGDQLGISVAISSDGRVVAAGAEKGGSYAKVYRAKDETLSLYVQVGGNLVGNEGAQFKSLALSANGERLVVGTVYWGQATDPRSAGKTLVFAVNGNDSDLIGEFVGEAAGSYSGWSVAVSEDGTRIAVGAPYNVNKDGTMSGHVRVFDSHN